MMKITNNFGLPGAIVEAIKNDSYTPGEKTDMSVTGLLSPPRQKELSRKHSSEIVEDASDRIWALMGQAIHSILERAEKSAIVEERLYMDADGWVISGQYDRITLRQKTLQDYKMMSVWEIIHGLKPDKTAQLNMLMQLAVENGYKNITNLEIVAIFRDWQKSKAKYDNKYPQSQVVRIKVDVWPEEKRLEYISERVAAHKSARNTLPECTPDERWATPDKYAVMKKGRKSAVRLLETRELAEKYITDKNVVGGYIDFRRGESRRCADYCYVNGHCKQWENLKP
jgi:predicted component of type VI protein secretion system